MLQVTRQPELEPSSVGSEEPEEPLTASRVLVSPGPPQRLGKC